MKRLLLERKILKKSLFNFHCSKRKVYKTFTRAQKDVKSKSKVLKKVVYSNTRFSKFLKKYLLELENSQNVCNQHKMLQKKNVYKNFKKEVTNLDLG